jgi:hypothetical protein
MRCALGRSAAALATVHLAAALALADAKVEH